MLRSRQYVFSQKMNEGELFRARLLNGIDGADEAVLKPWILFLNEARELCIGRGAPQRNDQRLDDCSDNRGQQHQPQPGNRPSGNGGRIRQRETN